VEDLQLGEMGNISLNDLFKDHVLKKSADFILKSNAVIILNQHTHDLCTSYCILIIKLNNAMNIIPEACH
jgi:ABC-type phosphate/phosphonate transport system ATPase subunit